MQSGVFACFLKGRSGEGSGMTASRSMHGWWRREREQQRRHQSQSASALESPPRRPSMSLCLLGRHGQKGGCLSVNRLMSLQWAGTRWPTRRGASYLGGQRMKMPSASGWRGLLRRHGRSRMWSSRSVASKHRTSTRPTCGAIASESGRSGGVTRRVRSTLCGFVASYSIFFEDPELSLSCNCKSFESIGCTLPAGGLCLSRLTPRESE